jgi:hypothetical protein
LTEASELHGYVPVFEGMPAVWASVLVQPWELCCDLAVHELTSMGFAEPHNMKVWMVLRKLRHLLTPPPPRKKPPSNMTVVFASGQHFRMKEGVTAEAVCSALCVDAEATAYGDPGLHHFQGLVNWVAHVPSWDSQLAQVQLVAVTHALVGEGNVFKTTSADGKTFIVHSSGEDGDVPRTPSAIAWEDPAVVAACLADDDDNDKVLPGAVPGVATYIVSVSPDPEGPLPSQFVNKAVLKK